MSGPSPPKVQNFPLPNVQSYMPGGQPGMDQSYQDTTGQLSGYASYLPSQVIPSYQSVANQINQNPYAAPTQQAAEGIGSLQGGLGAQQIGYGNNVAGFAGNSGQMTALGNMAGAAGGQVLNTAFDPQRDLYNRGYQQMTDQSNATNAMYGLASSPYGAGVANQNASNFNMDWQNNQLQRQIGGIGAFGGAAGTAVGAYGGALNNAAGAYQGAAGLQQGGIGQMMAGSQAPYSQYVGNLQNDFSGLNAMTQGTSAALQPGQQQQQAMLNYLRLGQQSMQGTNATNASLYAATLGAQQQAYAAQQQASAGMFGGIGSLLGLGLGGWASGGFLL